MYCITVKSLMKFYVIIFLHFIWVRGCYCQHPKHPSYYGLVLFTVYLQLEFRPTLFVLFADSV